jgi:nitrite reductase/ring-hydroxylating ferredoxin subunit/uncharacterized membrane protein
MAQSQTDTETMDAAETALPSLNLIRPEENLKAIPGLEDAAEQVARGIHDVVLKGGPPARRAADLLHGTWLGHPLHPVLTDVTIGAWLFGSVLDLLSLGRRSRGTERAADKLITLGTLSAVPTALAGLTDFSTIPSNTVATGAAHGLINTLALVLYGLSLRSRGNGSRATAMLLSGMGLGLILVSAWLGGELSFRYRVGVNRAKKPKGLDQWTDALDAADLPEQEPRRVEVKGQPVLLYRRDGQVCAIGAVCAHAGGPLDEGKFMGNRVECPWHQSVYNLCNGRVVHGPSTYQVAAYETRTQNGKVQIRARQ